MGRRNLTLQRLDTLFIFLFQVLQFLTRFLLVGLLVPFGSRGFSQGILRLADHQKLGIGILDELGLQGDPSKVPELLSHSSQRKNRPSDKVPGKCSEVTYDAGYSGSLGSCAKLGPGNFGFFAEMIQLPRWRRPKFSWISPSWAGMVST